MFDGLIVLKPLLTWWLFGPGFVIFLFCAGFVLWQTVNCCIKRAQKKHLAAINSSKSESDSLFDRPNHKSIFKTMKTQTIDIQFSKLGLRLRTDGSKVLQGVTGEIKSGRMTAVMGPSGSGKTTFMTTIAGKAIYGKMTGKILINGRDDLPIGKFRNITGFVPQEDIMIREMTVEETLRFSAMTRLPKTMSTKEKLGIVEDALEILDLQHIRYSIIGDENVRGISGGQRKRVNIGIELVSDPTLLFLDEPTSGLDSSSSMSICGALRQIAELGLTIVAVIHQPRYEIFELFHDVLLLAKGGRTVYQGPTKDALAYFEGLGYQCPNHSNPADFLIDIISELQPKTDGEVLTPTRLVKLWKSHQKELIAIRMEMDGADENGLNYDIGVNPVNLSDVKEFFREMYHYGTRRDALLSLDEESETISVTDVSVSREPEVDLGTPLSGVGYFLLILLTFFTAPLCVFTVRKKSPPSLYRQYGGAAALLLGAIALEMVFGIRFMTILMSPDPMVGIGYIGVVFFCAIPSLLIFIGGIMLYNQFRWRRPLFYGKDIIGGMFGWIFYVLFTWNSPGVTIKRRMAKLFGLFVGMWWMYTLTASILMQAGQKKDDAPMFPYYPEALGFAGFILLVFFLFSRRMHILPIQIRPKPAFISQLYQTVKRSLVQITRSWMIYIFDLLLVINAGIFIGIIYYQQYYIPPLIESLPNQQCPAALPDKLCTLLNVPEQDPLSGQASITCLALALAAVASSLRIFGDERVSFRRESTAGLSTEAYYLGKSLAHLPTEILAPLMFTLCYYAFVLPIAPFYQYLFLYFGIYWSCSGLAFLVSLVSPPSLSQLAGVLTVLTFMMFSGAAPTLTQLVANELLPYVLWAVSWLSLFRYTQELYYLIGIAPYNPLPDTATLVHFGYHMGDQVLCWAMIFSLGVFFRILAYVALVWRERKN